MKFIMAQPSILRFKWELEVQLTNLLSLGVNPQDIILLMAVNDQDLGVDPTLPQYFVDKFGVQAFPIHDGRPDNHYIPSIKPYLWWQFLEQNPEMESESFFYMDCDVLLREIPDTSEASENLWLCSDTISYIGVDYIKSKKYNIFEEMQAIVGVDVSDWQEKSGGAQWVIVKPKALYWKKVYEDSIRLYDYFTEKSREWIIEEMDTDYTGIQVWTAEMWAQLWNMKLWGVEPKVVKELDFVMAYDPIERWKEVKIFHNAGVIDENQHMFFKGMWTNTSPLDQPKFDFVDKDKMTYIYVEAIEKAKEFLMGEKPKNITLEVQDVIIGNSSELQES